MKDIFHKNKTWNTLIKCSLNALIFVISCLFCLFFLEFTYRFQFIDFYKTELNYFNNLNEQNIGEKKVLVFGDSFTANSNNYINILNNNNNNITFLNAAMPGVGIQEINCIAKNRIEAFKPKMIIVQLYVGNDLLDIKKPINWHSISLFRNLYWHVSNRFYSIRYLNYKLGQLKEAMGQAIETELVSDSDTFSTNKMSKREYILTQADPNYYEKSINISDEYEARFSKLSENLNDIHDLCKKYGIPLKVLIIPASCQVSLYYKNNLEKCGAYFEQKNTTDTIYPFINKLTNRFKVNSIEFLNPLSMFQRADSSGHRLYYENDIHLNKEGNIVLAKFLDNKLKNEITIGK